MVARVAGLRGWPGARRVGRRARRRIQRAVVQPHAELGHLVAARCAVFNNLKSCLSFFAARV